MTHPRTIKIVLMPDQRKRVFDRTGIDIEVLELEDEDGVLHSRIRHMSPLEVEKLAYRKADRLREAQEVESSSEQEEEELKATQEKIQALEQSIAKEVEAMTEALAAFFGEETQAAEAAREAAKRARKK